MRLRVLAAAAALLAAAAPALARAPQAPDRGPGGEDDGPPGWPRPQPICSAGLNADCPDPGLEFGLCLRQRLDMSPGCRAIQERGSAQPAWSDEVGRDPPQKPPG